jgi:molecular chaperone GrpE
MTQTPKPEPEQPIDPSSEAGAKALGPGPEPTPTAEEMLARLTDHINTIEAEKAELNDRLLRTAAEMDNIRKRLEREKADQARYAITKFATDVVTLGDNLGHALRSFSPAVVAETPAVKNLLDGVVMTDRAFIATLERHGIRRIDPAGEVFNPHLHQAVQQEVNGEVPAGTILRVLQTGYVLGDRVLRPAAVIVAEGGPKPAKPATSDPVQPEAAKPEDPAGSTDAA